MSALPVEDLTPDPDDPVEILRVLPKEFHDQFRTEYHRAAAEAARQVEGYRTLHRLLRLWRLRAVAYSDPDYQAGRAAVEEAARTGNYTEFVPVEDVIPDWRKQVERRRHERGR
jgi:hypothetical protein